MSAAQTLAADPRISAFVTANAGSGKTKTLVDRVARRETRPLLKGRDPFEVLTELAAVRNPVYAEAHIHISSKPSPHDITVSAILAALKQHGPTK